MKGVYWIAIIVIITLLTILFLGIMTLARGDMCMTGWKVYIENRTVICSEVRDTPCGISVWGCNNSMVHACLTDVEIVC